MSARNPKLGGTIESEKKKNVIIISQRIFFNSISHFQAKFGKGCDLMLLNEIDYRML